MECILDWIYFLLKNSAGENEKYSSTEVWNVFLDCNYFLLKAPLGRESNTVPQGYGKYFRLYFSLIESSAGGGGGQVQFHKDMEVF